MFELTEEDFQNPFDAIPEKEKLQQCKTCESSKDNLIISFDYKDNSFLITIICAKCKTMANSIQNWNSGKYNVVGKKKSNKRKRVRKCIKI